MECLPVFYEPHTVCQQIVDCDRTSTADWFVMECKDMILIIYESKGVLYP
jgi:hypothetical protein